MIHFIVFLFFLFIWNFCLLADCYNFSCLYTSIFSKRTGIPSTPATTEKKEGGGGGWGGTKRKEYVVL